MANSGMVLVRYVLSELEFRKSKPPILTCTHVTMYVDLGDILSVSWFVSQYRIPTVVLKTNFNLIQFPITGFPPKLLNMFSITLTRNRLPL